MQATTIAPVIILPLEFKIINKAFNENLSKSDSEDFKKMKKDVEAELEPIYRNKFKNFKSVAVTGFKNGSVVVISEVVFENISTTATNDNTVRALLSSLGSNSSIGGFQILLDSIKSDTSNVTNLKPLNIIVSFLIKSPFNETIQPSLKNQTVQWIEVILQQILNASTKANVTITFININNWTQTTANFSFRTENLLDDTKALDQILEGRGNASFTIVPSSLEVNTTKKMFSVPTVNLGLMNVVYSADLADKTSTTFQTRSKAIEDSLKVILNRMKLVEPVVTSFRQETGLTVASVDLYFPSGVINETDIRVMIVNNLTTFKEKDIILDPLTVIPEVRVSVASTLRQDYTADLSNSSSPTVTSLQNKLLNVLTPILKKFYSNSLQDSPSVTFSNDTGSAAMLVQYKLNTTSPIVIMNVVDSLIQNTTFTDLIRKASLSVNDEKKYFQVFKYSPRFTNLIFTDELKNRKSQAFMDLEQKINTRFTNVLEIFSLAEVVVTSCVPGSVIANTELTFPSGVTSAQVANTILNNRATLENFGLALDPQSIQPSTSVSTPSPSTFPGYAVAIIVMCILAILAIPLLICLCMKSSVCQKLAKACSLKPPYYSYEDVVISNKGFNFPNYRSHSYDLPR
ncbi:uncharacterized protein O3C94_008745 [Discoglossus pictus]